MHTLNQIMPLFVFYKNDKNPFTKYLTHILRPTLRQPARLFIYFIICLYPQSKSSHYTSLALPAVTGLVACFLLISFKSWFNILRKRKSSLCTLGNSGLPGKAAFLLWLFLQLLQNHLNIQGLLLLKNQFIGRCLLWFLMENWSQQTIFSNSYYDYFSSHKIFVIVERMWCHTPFLFFERFARSVISIVSFVIQVKGIIEGKDGGK